MNQELSESPCARNVYEDRETTSFPDAAGEEQAVTIFECQCGMIMSLPGHHSRRCLRCRRMATAYVWFASAAAANVREPYAARFKSALASGFGKSTFVPESKDWNRQTAVHREDKQPEETARPKQQGPVSIDRARDRLDHLENLRELQQITEEAYSAEKDRIMRDLESAPED